MDVSGAIQIDDVADFDKWLAENGETAREVIISIYKKSSGKQTVTLNDLQEVALCHGWVDNLGQRVDEERWALRLTPRKPKSNWSPPTASWRVDSWPRAACWIRARLCCPPTSSER